MGLLQFICLFIFSIACFQSSRVEVLHELVSVFVEILSRIPLVVHYYGSDFIN